MSAARRGAVATGRWISAQRPSNVQGNSAASLSSGGISDPAALVAAEVAGRGQADERAAVRVAGVGDQVLVAAAGDAGILDSEALCPVEQRMEAALRLDRPVA